MTKLLSIVGAIALGALGTWLIVPKLSNTQPPQPPLMSLEQMGHLVSVKVNYANVIEFTEKLTKDIPWTNWELRFGGTKVLLVARGDCLVGTDFRLAKYQEVDKTSRSAVLVLPAPKSLSARVNHDPREKGGSYFYAITATGIEPIIPGSANRTKAIDAALGKAQQEIARVCGSAEVVATAKRNAEAVLLPAFSASGWKVNVRWLM
ncbi:MAG TPA: DUF4230 domain-containing protein [Noviherbaspirillum sp.]|uniref:DUF4230 domain-containing protein n=1 Tax=Noviherbaspirillum sp. TaxID=1926288 RepID=UPI002B4926C8|nr:DUF4230 domain-containing protein [Noviherbaspirillum sp.]HJV83884.1 DUF4230 domain-containing protein [Noviherbaspirillum sp.]